MLFFIFHMILKRHDLTDVCVCNILAHKIKIKIKKKCWEMNVCTCFFFYFLRAYIDRGRGERHIHVFL